MKSEIIYFIFFRAADTAHVFVSLYFLFYAEISGFIDAFFASYSLNHIEVAIYGNKKKKNKQTQASFIREQIRWIFLFDLFCSVDGRYDWCVEEMKFKFFYRE